MPAIKTLFIQKGYESGHYIAKKNRPETTQTNNYEIRRQKSMARWFFIPVSAAMLLNLLRTTGIYSWAVVILMIAASTLGLIVQHRAIRPLMTKKDDLDALRKILIESENN